MFTKIYEKTKNFIKENYKELLIYVFILLLFTIRLPFYIYIGGGLIDLRDRIDLKSNETGSYNLVYVKKINATIPTYLLSYVIKSWELENANNYKYDEDENESDIDLREKLYLEEANNNAIVCAYKLAGYNVNIKNNSFKIIYVSNDSDTDVKIGDKLISINDVKVNNNFEYKEYLKTLKIGDHVSIKVIRDGKIVDCYANLIKFKDETLIGLYLINDYDYEVDPEINLKFNWNESGPSGGFMLSLAIYDRLVTEDLTRGRKIVGTGTIDINGNVGEIGGVKHKLIGAVQNKADIFFVPAENYEEAIETKKRFNYNIKIVKIKSLQEAIDYLKQEY